jgi:hypothetical protein
MIVMSYYENEVISMPSEPTLMTTFTWAIDTGVDLLDMDLENLTPEELSALLGIDVTEYTEEEIMDLYNSMIDAEFANVDYTELSREDIFALTGIDVTEYTDEELAEFLAFASMDVEALDFAELTREQLTLVTGLDVSMYTDEELEALVAIMSMDILDIDFTTLDRAQMTLLFGIDVTGYSDEEFAVYVAMMKIPDSLMKFDPSDLTADELNDLMGFDVSGYTEEQKTLLFETLEKIEDLVGDLSSLTLEEIDIMTETDISAYDADALAIFMASFTAPEIPSMDIVIEFDPSTLSTDELNDLMGFDVSSYTEEQQTLLFETLEKIADLEGDLSSLTLEEIDIMTETDISAYDADALALFLSTFTAPVIPSMEIDIDVEVDFSALTLEELGAIV